MSDFLPGFEASQWYGMGAPKPPKSAGITAPRPLRPDDRRDGAAAVATGNLGEVDIVPDQIQHKAGEMVLGHLPICCRSSCGIASNPTSLGEAEIGGLNPRMRIWDAIISSEGAGREDSGRGHQSLTGRAASEDRFGPA
jgi:hypothetical protein